MEIFVVLRKVIRFSSPRTATVACINYILSRNKLPAAGDREIALLEVLIWIAASIIKRSTKSINITGRHNLQKTYSAHCCNSLSVD